MRKDLTGQKFGRWTVLYFSPEKRKVSQSALWMCKCDCGSERLVSSNGLSSGRSTSCGCFHAENLAKRVTKHGQYKTPEHKAWEAMTQRCYNPNAPYYHCYGGRGITVCDRWRFSYENFIADIGKKPTLQHSIDRIDVNGNYEPSNCRWATPKEQSINRRVVKKNKE